MRHLLKTFMVLCVILMSSGCQKEPDLTPKQTDPFNAPFHEEITDTYLAFLQLISTIMREAATQPRLYFLQEIGDTRSGCPMAEVVGSDFPKVMTLKFSNCSAGNFNDNTNVIYNGEVPIEFTVPLGEEDASGPEIIVPEISGITINGYSFELVGGPIELELASNDTLFTYDFLLKGDIISRKNGSDITTTLPSGSCGTFATPSTDRDSPFGPDTYVDNRFEVTLKPVNVICSDGVNEHSLCTSTGEDPLFIQPSVCSCPNQGDLIITMGACGTTGGAISEYDFGLGITEGRGGAVTADDNGNCNDDVSEFTIIDFLSYEGDFVATNGPLMGRTSTDIGVDEQPAPAAGFSLQLTDAGSPDGLSRNGFKWTDPTVASIGAINDGQTITNTTTPNTPWINEIHYDNNSTDTGKGIEIAGPAGLNLEGYFLQPYNGMDGGTYNDRIALTGAIPDQGDGYGAVWIEIDDLQDGNLGGDGIALYREDNVTANFCTGR